MDRYLTLIKNKRLLSNLFVLLILSAISVIPIIKSYGRLLIGGDMIIPLIPEFSYHNAYEWLDSGNGIYFSNDYFPWISTFYLLKLAGLSLYQSAFVFQFLIFFLTALGVYKIYNLFNENSKFFGLIPAILIILSPHHYDHMIYFYTTVTIAWLTYFLMKFIKSRNMSFIDAVFISVLIAFIGNLPNPKYHFLVFVMYVVTIIGSLLIRQLTLRELRAGLKYFLLIVGMTLYLSIRFVYFGATFSGDDNVKVNTTQEVSGEKHALDFGGATISQMIRLWHTPSLNANDRILMDEPLFAISYYLYPIIILGLFPFLLSAFDAERRKTYYLIYFLAIFFIFLAKSSNPPLGFIYDWMVLSGKIFAFMRTSAGMVVYAAIFYAVLYGVVFQYAATRVLKNSLFILSIPILIVIPLITGYHMWSGKYIVNHSVVNSFINRKAYGLIVPQSYFDSAYLLEHLRLDTKIDIFFGLEAYQNNKWGYFGPAIYPHFLDKATIHPDKTKVMTLDATNTNAFYVYHDKSLAGEGIINKIHDSNISRVFTSRIVDVYRKSNSQFLPHFYVPERIAIKNQLPSPYPSTEGYKLQTTTYLDNQSEDALELIPYRVTSPPVIEYKKINPTKYRVRVHKVSESFPLIFTDNYHKEWKLYVMNTDQNKQPPPKEVTSIGVSYVIFKDNESDQATQQELMLYIKEGSVSTLGTMQNQERKHYRFAEGRRHFDYSEKYAIDFISKNFSGTIQNDNLPNRSLFETIFQRPLHSMHHIKANGFSNSWSIDPNEICLQKERCIKNNDGTYDMEFVIEFWPQRLAYIGYILSGGLIMGGIFIKILRHMKKSGRIL